MTKEVRDALLAQKEWKDHVSVRHNPRVGMENLVFCSKTNNPGLSSKVCKFFFTPLTAA